MYSTKTLDNILLAELKGNIINKKFVLAESLSENTRCQYQYLEDIDTIKKVLVHPEYSHTLEAYKKGHIIYRGDWRNSDKLAAVVSPGIRVSQNTTNIYTRLVSDVFKSWQKFPKRNRGTICTTNIEKADNYADGYPFIIFPQNNTKIAICTAADFWDSFPFMAEVAWTYRLDDFNNRLTNFFKWSFPKQSIDDILELFNTGNTDDIIRLFHQSEQIFIESIKNNDYSYPVLLDRNPIIHTWYENYYTENATSLLDFIEYIMLPKKNKFRMISVDKIPKKANKEVWFEGQYLMIREDVANEIFF